MLTILPVALLFILALAVYILRYFPRGTGYAWLTAVLMSLIIWGGVLAYHWLQPEAFTVAPWRPFATDSADPIRLRWDSISWPFGFNLLSAVLAVLMTASARLRMNSNPLTWSTNLAVAGAAVAAVISDSPLALLLAWVMLDVIDLLLVMRLSRIWKYTSRGVMAFVVRTLSSFLLIGALSIHRSAVSDPLSFENMLPQASLLVLLSLGLRLGLLPLNTPYAEDFPFQRGLISFIRLSAYAAGLSALSHFPQNGVPANWQPILYFITLAVCLYGAIRWLTARDEIYGRPFWLLTLSGLAFICVLQGQASASIAWGVVMISSGLSLFLYSARTRGLLVLPVLGAFALTGLPFTPGSVGWAGLIIPPYNLGDGLAILVVALLLVGYIHHALRSGGNYYQLEGWARGIYPIGLFVITISGWITAFLGFPGFTIIGQWVPAVVSVVLAGAISLVLYGFLSQRIVNIQTGGWVGLFFLGAGRRLTDFFSLNWFYNFLWLIYRGIRQLVYILTLIFEGEGGLMWAFVLLALLLTVLSSGGFF
ncbi:MAG TPA: hypothetical protein VN364_07340 [Bellilinea sp.]|nr:hypothetical protein [Bellilinea sp.]